MKKAARGYLLIVLLGLIAAVMALMVGLISQGSSLGMLVRQNSNRLAVAQGAEDTANRLGLALSASGTDSNVTRALGQVTTSGKFTSTAPDGQAGATVQWNDSSVRYEVPPQYSTYGVLFDENKLPDPDSLAKYAQGDNQSPIPLVGYNSAVNTSAGFPVPVSSAGVALQGLRRDPKIMVYSRTFAYGAYAPSGSVNVDKVRAWTNPTLTESTEDEGKTDTVQSSGVPVWVRAQGAVTVPDFACGKAFSEQGPVAVSGGAIGYTRPQPQDTYCSRVASQVQTAMDSLTAGTQEKGQFIAGHFLSVEGVIDLFTKGVGAFEELITVEQAMTFPFPIFPVMQEDVVIQILILYHPFPADFSGSSGGDANLAKELAELSKEMSDLQDQIDKDEQQIEPLEDQLSDLQTQFAAAKTQQEKDAIQKQIDDVNAKLGPLKKDEDKLKGELDQDKKAAKKLQKEIEDQGSSVNGGSLGKVPQTAWDDANQPAGSGWAYINFLTYVTKQLFKSKNIQDVFNAIAPQIRLVHLGSLEPEWTFQNNDYSTKATWTVPAGRTLQLAGKSQTFGNVTIQGDLWIQRGATCYVKGNLSVENPGVWQDIKGASLDPDDQTGDALEPDTPIDPATNPLFPWGRVILEEGATLVVDGNLNVTGGNRDTGGIVVCSKVGSVRSPSTAVLVKGDVNVPYGVYSGMTFDDMVRSLGQDTAWFNDFYSKFLSPALRVVFPNLAKVIGPWNNREPAYFAEFATSFIFFTFLDEIGLGEVPVPIPLPIDNCERNIFTRLSQVYSFELNYVLGENLYTMTNWWLFGRGVVPMMLKVDPKSVEDALGQVNYAEVTWDTIKEAVTDFIQEAIPDMLKLAINEMVVKTIENLMKEEIPFDFPSCPGSNEKEEEKELEERLKEEAERIIEGELKKNLYRSFEQILLNIRNKIEAESIGEADADFLCREVPGVFVYSGGKTTIGNDGNTDQAAIMASGFFFSRGDLYVGAEKIVGSLVSSGGNVRGKGELLYYPYFGKASLYNPDKPQDELEEGLQILIPRPDNDSPIDLGAPHVRVTASGWQR